MQTMDVNEQVSATFESCGEFTAPGDGSPVCEACGWLAQEHEQPGAVVHRLPRRRDTPKRLAS